MRTYHFAVHLAPHLDHEAGPCSYHAITASRLHVALSRLGSKLEDMGAARNIACGLQFTIRAIRSEVRR